MKDRIREAAVQEIRRRGIKFSVRELAGSLGISTKTLYQHFASKEQLVADLVRHSIQGMRERESIVLNDASLSTERKLYEALIIVPQAFAFIDARLFHELKIAYPAQWRVLDEYMNKGWDNIRILVRQGVEEGSLRPFDVELFIDAYVGALYRMMDFEVSGSRGLPLDKALALTVDFLMYGIAIGRGENRTP